jgi:hypothetical protein
MNKQGILIGIALTFLLGIALATSTTLSATSDVIIYAFDQNPAGSDDGNEWVTFHNPSNESVDIGNWTFVCTHDSTVIDQIPEGTTLYPGAYCTYTLFYRWLDNSDEASGSVLANSFKPSRVVENLPFFTSVPGLSTIE